MKKLLILLNTTLLFSGIMWAQCPAENITIENQYDVDNFPTDYPGCTVINGDLIISFFAIDLTNLAGLSQLTAINGNLEFEVGSFADFSGLDNLEAIGGDFTVESTGISNFQGLENLTSIGGDFRLLNNYNLNSFTGLSNLASIGGTFRVSNVDNGTVTDFTGLEALSLIGGGFTIDGGNGFSSFDGLENLNSIGGDFFVEFGFTSAEGLSNLSNIGGSLTLSYTLLSSFEGLENLNTIGEYFLFHDNNHLTDISALSGLNTIGGQLNINNNLNTGFTNLSGLENLTSIGGALNISYNVFLTNITSLENLDYTSISNLTIESNLELAICDIASICNYLAAGGTATIGDNAFGCATQSEVEDLCMDGPICPLGSVTISTQQEIDDFPTNYPGCTVISGDITITEGFTDPITNLNGLSQIEMITGDLTFGDYLNVSDLTAFTNLTSVGGDLSFNNSRVNSLDGLENLSSVGGNLTLEDNALLTDISGLSGLTSVGGDLIINNNDNLSNLIGLENLTAIIGILNISNNAALTTLTAIENLNHIGVIYLIVENNTNLSICSVTSICNYLAAGSPSSIFNNASDCNSQAEVELVCNDPCSATPLMSVNDQPILDGIYQAANEVNSVGTVPSGGNVNFKAGQTILLDQNFIIESNANFSAEIEDCGQ